MLLYSEPSKAPYRSPGRTRIIVVDDSSSDNSWEKICTVDDECLRAYRNTQNIGAAASRNRILDLATGKYICFIDDDDTADPLRIEYQINHLINSDARSDQPIVNVASIERTYPNGFRYLMSALGTKGPPPNGTQLMEYLLLHYRDYGVDYGFGVPTCSLMCRTSLLIEIGGFDPRLKRVEDTDACIRMCLHGVGFTGTEKYLVRQLSTSGSHKSPLLNYQCELLLIGKYIGYLTEINMTEYAFLSARLRYAFFKKAVRNDENMAYSDNPEPYSFFIHFGKSALKRIIFGLHQQLSLSKRSCINFFMHK